MREKIFIVSVKIGDEEIPTDKEEIQQLLWHAFSSRMTSADIISVEVFDTFQGDLSKPSEVIS